jgi:hypothetical protein
MKKRRTHIHTAMILVFILCILSILLESALHDSHHSFIPHPSALIPYDVVRCLPNIHAMRIETM